MSKDNVEIKNNEQESSAIKIKSIQAASLYRVNNNYKFVLKIKNEDGSSEKRNQIGDRLIAFYSPKWLVYICINF